MDDPLERQAEHVADRVTRMPAPGVVQRACACEGGQNTKRESDDEAIHGSFLAAPGPVGPDLEHRIRAIGDGEPLSASARAFFEPRFAHDFSRVRVHSGAEAAGTARALSARAYTRGSDIVFSSGQYAPETAAGRHLLAHELTHVVQQS